MKPLHIILKSSMILIALAISITVAAGAILIPLPLSWQIKLLILAAMLMTSVYAVCLHGLRVLPWSLVSLEINAKNELNLRCLNGRRVLNVKLSDESVATPYLVVIRYKPTNTHKLHGLLSHYLVVLPDAIEADQFRQLRVWLRWGAVRKSERHIA